MYRPGPKPPLLLPKYVSARTMGFFNKLVEFTVKFQTAYSKIEFVWLDFGSRKLDSALLIDCRHKCDGKLCSVKKKTKDGRLNRA